MTLVKKRITFSILDPENISVSIAFHSPKIVALNGSTAARRAGRKEAGGVCVSMHANNVKVQ